MARRVGVLVERASCPLQQGKGRDLASVERARRPFHQIDLAWVLLNKFVEIKQEDKT